MTAAHTRGQADGATTPRSLPLVRDVRDLAAHQASGRSPLIGFTQVAPAGRSLARPPLFLLGPASPDILRDLFAQLATPAIGCFCMADATVAPTGFAISGGIAFYADAFLHPRHVVVSISDRLNAETLPTRHIDGEVAVLCGPAHETYGHWLVDFLPRLWVLREAGYPLDSLRYLVPADLRPFGFALLRLCGVADSQLVLYHHWHEVLQVEHLLLPTGPRLGDRLAPCFATATSFWIARAAVEAACPQGRLYLARVAGTQRHLVNRSRIEAIAADSGLTVMRPEDFSLREQIALFASADIVVGEYGSALHNSVFAGVGAAVCALRGVSRHPSLVQTGIATALQQEVGYVFGGTEGDETDQAFFVNERDFRSALAILQVRSACREADHHRVGAMQHLEAHPNVEP